MKKNQIDSSKNGKKKVKPFIPLAMGAVMLVSGAVGFVNKNYINVQTTPTNASVVNTVSSIPSENNYKKTMNAVNSASSNFLGTTGTTGVSTYGTATLQEVIASIPFGDMHIYTKGTQDAVWQSYYLINWENPSGYPNYAISLANAISRLQVDTTGFESHNKSEFHSKVWAGIVARYSDYITGDTISAEGMARITDIGRIEIDEEDYGYGSAITYYAMQQTIDGIDLLKNLKRLEIYSPQDYDAGVDQYGEMLSKRFSSFPNISDFTHLKELVVNETEFNSDIDLPEGGVESVHIDNVKLYDGKENGMSNINFYDVDPYGEIMTVFHDERGYYLDFNELIWKGMLNCGVDNPDFYVSFDHGTYDSTTKRLYFYGLPIGLISDYDCNPAASVGSTNYNIVDINAYDHEFDFDNETGKVTKSVFKKYNSVQRSGEYVSFKAADFDLLRSAYEMADNYGEENYTAESVAEIQGYVSETSELFPEDMWGCFAKACQSIIDDYAIEIFNACNSAEYLADYTHVETMIDDYGEYASDESYTLASRNAIQEAIDAVVYGLGTSEQDRVNQYATNIANAGSLRELIADYTAVDDAIARPTALYLYTQESRQAFEDARDSVVRGLGETQQETVDGYALAINNAVDNLEGLADYSAVDIALERIPIDLSIYTNTTKTAVIKARDSVTRGKGTTEQTTVDGYALAINTAVENLITAKPADYTQVDNALATIPENLSLYTQATKDVLKAAQNAVVRGKSSDEQDIVNGYATAIQSAVSGLIYKDADYSAVNSAIATIPADLSMYTSATANAVTTARNAIVTGKDIREQETIDRYATTLRGAIDALVYKDADYTAVNTALASIPADMSIYTEETAEAVEEARDAVVTGKDITEQAVVTAYVQPILDAVDALVYKDADYTAVEEAQANIPADLSLYTTATAEAVTNANDAIVTGKDITEQETVDDYATTLQGAIDALVYKDADYTAVEEAQANIPADLSLYTTATAEAVTNANDAIVTGKNITEQETVDNYATTLQGAIDALDLLADYTAVEEALENIPADLSIYSPETQQAVETARDAVVLGKGVSEQTVVTAYATAINTAVQALSPRDADYTAVDEAISSIPQLYAFTETTRNAVIEAKGNVVRGKKMDEQAVVDGYVEAIYDALDGLELIADYSAVDEAIMSIPNLNLYKAESVATVTTAKNAVVRGKGVSKQTEVTAYATAIESAVEALEYKDADYTAVDEALDKIPNEFVNKYTTSSASAVMTAQEAVVRGKNITEQSVVNGYAKALNTAIMNLELYADYSMVDQAIESKPTDMAVYTEATITAVNDAISGVIRGKGVTQQAVVNAYATAINEAISKLVYLPANYTAVATAISSVPTDLSKYTTQTKEAVEKAVDAVVYEKNITEQAIVTSYATAINNAVAGLVEKIVVTDLTNLNDTVAEMLTQTTTEEEVTFAAKYTAESYSKYKLALDDLQAKLASEASEAEITACVVAVNTAYAGLVEAKDNSLLIGVGAGLGGALLAGVGASLVTGSVVKRKVKNKKSAEDVSFY